MRKLYEEFFYVPKCGKGKIRDKVMLMRTALTVVVMVVCLAAMGITAYAYFAYNITSASNLIQTANFQTKVSIQISDSENQSILMEQPNKNSQTATLQAGKSYIVTIAKEGTAKTGFCVISATGCDVKNYHTQQIGENVRSDAKGMNSITFTLIVTDTTVVSFYSHWGTSSYYADYEDRGINNDLYIIDGETVIMQINGVTKLEGEFEEEVIPPETKPMEVVHVVGLDETLSMIAGLYNTTPKHIMVYNEIADINSIQAGQEIKIPPVEWILPEPSISQPISTPEITPVVAPSPETSELESTTEPTSTDEITPEASLSTSVTAS